MHEARASNRLLGFFGLGQLSRSLVWCVTDLLIGYHLTVRLGLPGSVAGIILFASFLLGAVLDLLIAAWVERGTQMRHNVLRLQAVAGAGSVVSGALLFAPPPAGIDTVLYICLWSVIFRFAYATLDVCQNALTSLLPRTGEETRRYVVTRTFVSSVGRLAASGLVFAAMRATNDDHADFWAVAWVALPVGASVFGLYHVGRRHIDRNEVVVTAPFRWSHLPLRRLATPVFAMVMEVGFLGLMTRLIPLGLQGSSMVVAMVCGTIAGPAVGYICTNGGSTGLLARFGLTFGAAAVGAALLTCDDTITTLLLAFSYGVALTGINNIIWERVALITTEQARLTGVRTDAMAFALLTASINVAIGISNAWLAIVHDGFKTQTSESSAIIVIVLLVGALGTAWALNAAETHRSLAPVH